MTKEVTPSGKTPATPVFVTGWKAVLMAARPKTLPAAVVPVWTGCVLAHGVRGVFDLGLAGCTLAGALCIQVATNLFNDAIDAAKGADTERRLGPKRVTASGVMSRRAVLVWACGFLLAAVAFGVPLFRERGWPMLVIGVPSLFLAYGYTGGPVPLAYRGLGELFVLLFFGWVAVAGTVFVQTGEWLAESWLLGGQVGLLSAVLISVNNLRDREEDAMTGKRTLAVRWGPRVARCLVWAEVKVAAVAGLGWLAFGKPWWVLATLPMWTLGFWLGWGALTMPAGRGMNRLLAMGALQLVAFGGLFHLLEKCS